MVQNKISRVVFDIETAGFSIESFDETQQEYLLKFADTEEKREAEIQKLSLYPLTAQIIAIGMLNPDTIAGKVFYRSNQKERFYSDDGKVEFISGDEKEILQQFWEAIPHYDQFITFNGRAFDCPFIMLRSVITGVKATRSLAPYRYDSSRHCDLLEQLTFYNTVRKFNLDFYCKAFGIKSPKSEGITGLNLNQFFIEGKYKEIAHYCLGDIKATAELFLKWNEYINVKE